MSVTEEDKKKYRPETQPLLAKVDPVANLEEAEDLLKASDRPFVMFRYRQALVNDRAEEKDVVRTAILYRKDGESQPLLIDAPEPVWGSLHPVKLVLLTMANLFFPRSEAPLPADEEIFDVIRGALEEAGLDRHVFDGGGNQIG